MPLPKDREELLLLREELQDLKEMRAFRLFQERILALQDQSIKALESTEVVSLLFRSQGEVVALRKVARKVDDLIQEVQNTLNSIVESPK